MGDRSGDASALLGMEGFVVLSQSEEDGVCGGRVERRADVVGGPSCGVRATGHGRSEVQVRDLAMGGRPVRLVWRKRRWICLDPDCRAKSFTEDSDLIEGSLTARAATEICRRVGQDAHSVAQVARDMGVGWATAMDCVRRHGEPLADDPCRIGATRALGIDEHKVLGANKDHHTLYATSFVDVVTGQLLDVVRGRSADDVAYWLTQGSPSWRQRIEAVAIDPHAGYLKGIMAVLPDVTVTVDHFHAIKLANAVIDDVRRRTQHSTLGHRGHKDDPLYRTRRLMTRGWERLSDRQRQKLLCALAEGDPTGEVGAAILGKELLRESYFARTERQAHWRLVRFYAYAAEADVAELTRLATTISRWEQEVLSFHTTGISTGPVEAQNLVTEKIRRVAHGMRNFDNYRLRLLLHSGVKWDIRPTARIGGAPHGWPRRALNGRPRRTLDYMMPVEKLAEVVALST
jgi:transposase